MTKHDESEPAEDALCAVLAFYRLSRSLKNVDLALNLSWERLSTLGAVTLREPVSISQLSNEENVGLSAVSRSVAALQQQALVRCIPNSDDGRSVLVLSTPKGRAVLQKGVVRTLERLAALLNKLEDAELEAMADALAAARVGSKL